MPTKPRNCKNLIGLIGNIDKKEKDVITKIENIWSFLKNTRHMSFLIFIVIFGGEDPSTNRYGLSVSQSVSQSVSESVSESVPKKFET